MQAHAEVTSSCTCIFKMLEDGWDRYRYLLQETSR